MSDDTVTFVEITREVGRSDVHRRYRFRVGGSDMDAVVSTAAATVWRQAHPGATDDDLDAWAIREGEQAIRAKRARDVLDVTDVWLDHDVHEGRERPRYGAEGMPHR